MSFLHLCAKQSSILNLGIRKRLLESGTSSMSLAEPANSRMSICEPGTSNRMSIRRDSNVVDCIHRFGREEEGEAPKKFILTLDPSCCNDLCPDGYPRFDELYYKPSDKEKRKYQQTWNECPKIKIAPKKICCFEQIIMAPFEKRARNERPQTACDPNPKCAKTDNKCPKIPSKKCGAVRSPPRCYPIPRPKANCTKICAPFPSFSECKRPKPKPKRPVECSCFQAPSMCEVIAYLRKKEQK